MKILISTKNSKWKVVQNPLKGNFYTDVINFKSDSDKDLFLQQNVNSDWKNLDNYIEVNPTWTDEIHFNFRCDLSNLNMDRETARRCDFAIIYTGDKYWFYTLESSLPAQQVYTTIAFNAELDVFFNYGIDKIWKKNAQVEVQRGVLNDQTNFNFETTLLNTPEDHQPVLTLKDSGKDLFDGQTTGYLLYIQPKSRYISIPGLLSKTWNGTLQDTILLSAVKTNQNIQTQMIAINPTIYTYKDYGPSPHNYQLTVQHNGTRMPSTLSDKYIIIYIAEADKNNNAWTVSGDYVNNSQILSSPDVLRIVPINYVPTFTLVDSVSFTNGQQPDLTGIAFTTNGDNTGQFNITRNSTDRGKLKIVSQTQPIATDTFSMKTFTQTSISTGDLYNYSQYSKLFTRPYLNYQLTTQDGNSMVIDQVGLGNVSSVTFNRKRSISLESNASKVYLSQGMYFDDLRSPYTLQVNDNLTYFLSTSDWLTYAQNNQQSINQSAKQMRKSSLWDKIRGGLGIAGGVVSAGVGLATGGIGATLGLGGLAGSMTSGIQQIQQANNGINSLNASIADAQSGKEQLLDTGSEYQRLVDLDNPFSVRIKKLSLTQKQSEAIGYFFHKYGYSLPNLVDNPLNWLLNGKYWSFNQFTFDSAYQAFNESLSPQESKIAALSLSQGVRVWHWSQDLPTDWEVGNYNYRNI